MNSLRLSPSLTAVCLLMCTVFDLLSGEKVETTLATLNDYMPSNHDIRTALSNLLSNESKATQIAPCYTDIALTSNDHNFFQALDSWGKPEAGLNEGNVFWIGRPSECNSLTIQTATNRKVEFSDRVVKAIVKSKFLGDVDIPISWDICLPISCGRNETMGFLLYVTQTLNKNLGNESMVLLPQDVVFAAPGKFDFSFYSAVILFSVLLVCILLATLFDYFLQEVYRKRRSEWRKMSNMFLDSDEPEIVYESNGTLKRALITSMGLDNMELENTFHVKLLLSFSLKSNIPKLLSCSTSPSTIKCLNGIRVLSINWVVLGHTLFFLPLIQPAAPAINPLEFITHYSRRWPFLTISNGTVAVDSFFVLSGFLLTYLILPKLPQLKTSFIDCEQLWYWTKYVIKRYIRLMPSMAAVILFTVGIWKVLGNETGAMWQPGKSAMGVCQDSWWTNFLLINNFVYLDKMCLGWTWYLADDFQFYLLAILIFSLYLRYKIAGILSVFVLMTISVVSSFAFSLKNHLAPSVEVGWPTDDPTMPKYSRDWQISFNDYYIKPYFRYSAYALGMLLGFITEKHPPMSLYIPKVLNVFCWILSLTSFAVVLYSLAGIFHGHYPSFLESALYNAISRPLWALALCWVIFSCMHGYGGMINTFLSWKFWVPLGKLTYMVYLIHPLVLAFYYSVSEMKLLYSDINYAFLYVSILVMTYAISFLAVLLVESPLIQLEKVITSKPTTTPTVLLE